VVKGLSEQSKDMEPTLLQTPAAHALVAQLIISGIDHVFCVPGESYLSVLDALYETKLQLTVCRNEAGAAVMADAYGKAMDKPGICFVAGGPGAANALSRLRFIARRRVSDCTSAMKSLRF
jgi:acetolactate synthase I/II/III large subunit